jgi:citrate lyase subunit alpha/citrate CoA-transferase
MSASDYASPLRPDAAVNDLDVVVLGAAEVDRDFNVNVARTGDGRLIGGPGGHPDTAAGAQCTIIVTTLTAGGWPKLVESVGCITTPGQDVDVVVTEAGIAVAPHRPDLAERLCAAGLPVVEMEALIARAAAESLHRPVPISGAPRVLIEAREGHLMDTILSA